jgi:hypothetical protein
MINHARTLLLNLAGPADPKTDTPGSEYIPPYAPIDLGRFQALHQVLFGSDPDTEGLLYRTAQYMALLHATDTVDYVAELDPRFTYNPQTPRLMPYRSTQGLITGSPALRASGMMVGQPFLGRVKYWWDLTATASDTVQIVTPAGGAKNVTFSLVNSLSEQIKLADPNLSIRFSLSGGLSIGETWRLLYRVAPEPGLSDVLAKTRMLQLDGLFSDQEPYKSFNNLYRQQPVAALQLVGLLLALIYRTEELRVR